MKKIFILSIVLVSAVFAKAQNNINKELATAKTSYKAGKLEDAHFALQQSLEELDILIGKEVLKQLPEKMDTLKVVSKEDNVAGNVSFVGATVHRRYGLGNKKAEIEIVSNSPLLGTLNAFLTNPMLARLGSDGNSKVLKIQGYKSRLTKETDSEANATNNATNYKLEIPFGNALVTLNVNNSSESEIIAMANTIPLEKVAKLIQ